MDYGPLMDRAHVEQRIRTLAAQGWKVRDLASVFGIHQLQIQLIVEQQELDNRPPTSLPSGDVPSA